MDVKIVVLFVLCLGACDANKRILLEDNFYAIIQRLEALETKSQVLESKAAQVDTLQTKTQALESKSLALETEIAALKRENAAFKSTQHVAFYAKLTSDVTGPNHHIIFDDVKLNAGSAYNPIHGIFIAPTNGTYQFTMTACSLWRHYIALDLHVNTLIYDSLIAGDTAFNACSSKTVFVSLKQNDDVYIKHDNYGDYLLATSRDGYPSFGGVLLYAE